MTIGKPLKSSSIWDIVGHSSLIRLQEWTQMLVTERQKKVSSRASFWVIAQMEKKLTKFDKIRNNQLSLNSIYARKTSQRPFESEFPNLSQRIAYCCDTI